MKKLLIITILFWSSTMLLFSQTISGVVFDKKDGEPIMGASVLNGKTGVITDFDGNFTIAGKYGDKLTVKYIGYKNKTVSGYDKIQIGMGKGKYERCKTASASTSASTRTQTTSTKPSSSNTTSSYSSSSSSSSSGNYLETPRTADDGYKYILFSDLNYTAHWMGVMDANRNIIIPVTRKYNFITYHSVKGRKGYYTFELNGKKGVCDITGKEVIAPKYDYIYFSEAYNCFSYELNDKDYNLSLTMDSNGRIVPSSSSSSSSSYASSSSQSSSSSSPYGNLLYSGTYTVTGVVRNSTASAGDGKPYLTNLEIYDNAVVITGNGTVLRYYGEGTLEGAAGRMYGSSDKEFMFVTNGGLVRYVQAIKNLFGKVVDHKISYIDYGDTRSSYAGKPFNSNTANTTNNGGATYNYSVPYNNGGTYNNTYNNNNYNNRNTHQPRCKTCMGTGLCRNCNGSKLVSNAYTRKNEWCEVCHRKGLCPTCNGTGKSPFRH